MEARIEASGAGGAAAPLQDFLFRRVVAAPVDLAFRAWTSSGCVSAWWGPHGFANIYTAIEPHPGGRFHVHMQAPDGRIQPIAGHFVEIEAPHRVIFATAQSDEHGRIGLETLNTVTLAAHAAGTEMTVHARTTGLGPASRSIADDVWRQSLERLVSILDAI